MRALLAAGAKSPTHLNVALERYAQALQQLLARCVRAWLCVCVCVAVCVPACARVCLFWGYGTCIDRLMGTAGRQAGRLQ